MFTYQIISLFQILNLSLKILEKTTDFNARTETRSCWKYFLRDILRADLYFR